MTTFKSHDWIAVFLLAALIIFGTMSFFLTPKFEEGIKVILTAIVDALGMILSFKFGVHVASAQPTAPPGTIAQTTVQTTVQGPQE